MKIEYDIEEVTDYCGQEFIIFNKKGTRISYGNIRLASRQFSPEDKIEIKKAKKLIVQIK